MPRRELRATMKLQSETETQRNILKGEMNMLFQTESGQTVGPIGQGTWYLGEDPDRFDAECSALRAGVEAGMNLIDTAEMYGDGAAEELVGQAIQGLDRDKLFLVSKVYPFNAGRGDIRVSCEDSLMRMKTDHLDLYLLHWRGSVPLAETVECMEELKEDGLIRAWGVSNLDTDDMQEQIAGEHHATVPQILLAFLLAQPGVLPIPRTGSAQHAQQNAAAAEIRLSAEELALLDAAFPKPKRKTRLEIV